MGKPEENLRKAVAEFVKDRVEVSTLYQRRDGSAWKNVNKNKRWSKKKQYRMITKWRRRNVTIKHKDLYVTFQQSKKLIFYKDSSYTTRQKDFTLAVKDQGDRKWHNLTVIHFKVTKNWKNDVSVWGGFIGSTPQVPVAIQFAATKKAGKVNK